MACSFELVAGRSHFGQERLSVRDPDEAGGERNAADGEQLLQRHSRIA